MERVISVIPVGQSKVDHLQRCCQNILAKPNQNSLFDLLSTQNFRNLGLNKKTPLDTKFANIFALMLFFMNIPSVSIPLG